MYIYLIIFVFCTCASASRMKLIAGHVIFRHGDRTPLASYPSNPIKEKNWPNGYGQLTSIGIEQQYRLGQYLRIRYGSILSTTFDPREIFVRSTDFDRTLMSAESNLHGLYHQRNISNNRTSVQPISMHTERVADDFLLGQNYCPIVNRITEGAYQSETFKQLNEFYQPFFEKLQMWTNASNITLYNTQHIPDSVLVAHIHNKAPTWATEDVRKTLAEINNIIFYFSSVNDTVKRIRGGPVIQDVWSNMNRSVHHDTFYKLRMYSAHDTTVSAALAFLRIHYPFQPQYASALFIDLYKQNQTYYVKVDYLNVTDSNNPRSYLLEGCPKVECPLDIFTAIYQPLFPGKAEVECENKPSNSSRGAKAMVVLLSSIVVGLFLITLVTTMFRKRQASVQYTPLLTRDSADKAT